jgi:hypothetical protein
MLLHYADYSHSLASRQALYIAKLKASYSQILLSYGVRFCRRCKVRWSTSSPELIPLTASRILLSDFTVFNRRELKVDSHTWCYLALSKHITEMASVPLVALLQLIMAGLRFVRDCSSPYRQMTSEHTKPKPPPLRVKRKNPPKLPKWLWPPSNMAARVW